MNSLPERTDGKDQRGNPRKSFDELVQVVAPRPASGQMVNAAEGGFAVVLDDCFDEGEGLTLSVFQDRLMLLGVVRWNRKRDGKFRHGIKLAQDDVKILEIIHKNLRAPDKK